MLSGNLQSYWTSTANNILLDGTGGSKQKPAAADGFIRKVKLGDTATLELKTAIDNAAANIRVYNNIQLQMFPLFSILPLVVLGRFYI